jgi:hypothetical protein
MFDVSFNRPLTKEAQQFWLIDNNSKLAISNCDSAHPFLDRVARRTLAIRLDTTSKSWSALKYASLVESVIYNFPGGNWSFLR